MPHSLATLSENAVREALGVEESSPALDALIACTGHLEPCVSALRDALRLRAPKAVLRRHEDGHPFWNPSFSDLLGSTYEALDDAGREVALRLTAFLGSATGDALFSSLGSDAHGPALLALVDDGWVVREKRFGGPALRLLAPMAYWLETHRAEAIAVHGAAVDAWMLERADRWRLGFRSGRLRMLDLGLLAPRLSRLHDALCAAGDATNAARLMHVLWHVLWNLGPQDEGIRRLELTAAMRDVSDLDRARLEVALAFGRLGSTEELAALCARCEAHLEEPGWPDEVAYAWRAASMAAVRDGDRTPGIAAALRSVSVPGADPRQRLHLVPSAAMVLHDFGAVDDAMRLLSGGADEAERLGMDVPLFEIQIARITLYIEDGVLDRAVALCRSLLDAPASGWGQVRIWLNLGHALLYSGEAGPAREALETGLALCHSLHLPQGRAVTRLFLGCAHEALGRYAEARDVLRDGIEDCRAHGGFVYLPLGHAWCARASAALGDREGSLREAAAARKAAAKMPPERRGAVDVVLVHAALIRDGSDVTALAQAARLLSADPEDFDLEEVRARTLLAAHRPPDLRVARDGTWFAKRDGELVDLSRWAANRRLLAALVEAHPAGLDVPELVAVGWPGETLAAGSGQRRVYTAMNALRKAGLDGVLERAPDGGYRLDPTLRVERARSGPPPSTD